MQKSEDDLQFYGIILLFTYANNITLLENNKGTLINNVKTQSYKTKELGLQISVEKLNIWSMVEHRILKIKVK